MKTIEIKLGLDLPLEGAPRQEVEVGGAVSLVALVGDDYIGLKPTMLVHAGDKVALGQPLFTDKKNPGFNFTAPAGGQVLSLNRGAKRKFESLVIEVEDDSPHPFGSYSDKDLELWESDELRSLLQESGLWTSLRARPFGKIAAAGATPSSLFITAIDTSPLAPDPLVCLREKKEVFERGLKVLQKMLAVPLHLCIAADAGGVPGSELEGVETWAFRGPHPAGLPSTHIHFIDPVSETKQAWHVSYQDVIGIGHLLQTGQLLTEQVVALGGQGVEKPSLIRTRAGGLVAEFCGNKITSPGDYRILSGSVLDGRPLGEHTGFLGRYHNQISVVREGSGSTLFGWLAPGKNIFSATGLFLSSFQKPRPLPFLTAVWGGRRAIYPLGTYEKVMPLDIVAISLLKSIAVGDTEKSTALGCLELVEEDLALCSFVCPGKNEFGPMLRDVLTTIEKEG